MRNRYSPDVWRTLEQIVRENTSLLKRELGKCRFSGYKPRNSKEALGLLALTLAYRHGRFEGKVISGWEQIFLYRSPDKGGFILARTNLKLVSYQSLKMLATLNLAIALFTGKLLEEESHKTLGDLLARAMREVEEFSP